MTVGKIIGKLKENARLHAPLVIRRDVQFECKSIDERKIRVKIGVGQHIRVVAQRIGCQFTVNPIQPHGKLGREPVRRQKFNQPANAGLTAKALAHLARLFLRNARNFRQPFRLIFQNIEA